MQNVVFDLVILAVFVVGIYAFLFLPRQREFRRRQKLVVGLQPGTQVMTYGGLLGKVKEVDRQRGIVMLEVADGIALRFVAAAITGEFDAEKYAQDARKVMK